MYEIRNNESTKHYVEPTALHINPIQRQLEKHGILDLVFSSHEFLHIPVCPNELSLEKLCFFGSKPDHKMGR
ncbi:unnamed protein product [Fusarium graminearum]|nr:unnamed protein product [Fusarium graminearum]CAG1976860.1 unnamed protein product [Fusarium graminearum]VTO84522.1 unnamed protein product [Fusarium graminearum]